MQIGINENSKTLLPGEFILALCNDFLDFEILKGKVLTNVTVNKKGVSDFDGSDEIIFTASDGEKYKLYHEQDCCEIVCIESINGDFEDLYNTPIIKAELRTNSRGNQDDGSETWSFYTLATIKGYVDIRWHGESNGYYSERVDLIKL